MGKCILLTSRIVQVDVTSKTEGKAFADATGVPLLVKYDTRLRDNVAKNIVQDVTSQVQVSIWMHALPASEGRACVRTVLLLSSLYCEHCELLITLQPQTLPCVWSIVIIRGVGCGVRVSERGCELWLQLLGIALLLLSSLV